MVIYFCDMKLLLQFSLACIYCALPLISQAQQPSGGRDRINNERPVGSIIGMVLSQESGEPVEYATISLYRKRDSLLITGTISDEKGNFILTAKAGRYFTKVEFISHAPVIIPMVNLKPNNLELDLKAISMPPSISTLSEVEISAEKNQVEVGLDKKVFNVVKDLSNIGGDASDVLENIPSVIVDIEGNVSLRGSSNVRILINGKPSGLMGISQEKALEQIPANTIESVEVITNPSVKYDAEGMSGIINIILKKEKRKGLNGMLNITTGYPHRHNASLLFNYGMDKFNVFGNYGISYKDRPGGVIYHRETYSNDTITSLDQDGSFTRNRLGNNLRLGLDYNISKTSTITLSSHYSINMGTNDRFTDYRGLDFESNLESQYIRDTREISRSTNKDYAIGYQNRFNKKFQNLTADLSYNSGNSEGIMSMTEEYDLLNYIPDLSSPLQQQTNDLQNETNLIIRTDYVHPIGSAGRLEMGYKSGIRNKDIDFDVEEYSDATNDWFNLQGISNHFIYDEAIHAGYIMLNNKYGEFGYQGGIRVENSIITSRLVETNDTYKRNYTHFFPSIHLSQGLVKDNKIQISYSRRIKRPRSRSLNPFNSYADPLNLWVGNPKLNPELTNSYEIGHIKYWENGTLGTSIYYRHTDSIVQRIRNIDSSGISTTLPMNLSYGDNFGAEITFSLILFKWWKINGSFNYFRSIIDGTDLRRDYASDSYSYTGRLNSNTTIWKDLNLQAMFNYRGPRVTIQGLRKEMYFIDIGLKKDIFNKKGSLSFKVSDLLNSRKFNMETYGDNFYVETQYFRTTRLFLISFTYKINRYRMKERRKRGDEYEMEDMEF